MGMMRSMRFKSENENCDKMLWIEKEKHAKRSCKYVLSIYDLCQGSIKEIREVSRRKG